MLLWETYGGVEQRRQGEIQVRSRLVRELSQGYYRQPKTTAIYFTKGCFRSGDVGTITVSTVREGCRNYCVLATVTTACAKRTGAATSMERRRLQLARHFAHAHSLLEYVL